MSVPCATIAARSVAFSRSEPLHQWTAFGSQSSTACATQAASASFLTPVWAPVGTLSLV